MTLGFRHRLLTQVSDKHLARHRFSSETPTRLQGCWKIVGVIASFHFVFAIVSRVFFSMN
jgi:hypothetical protein